MLANYLPAAHIQRVAEVADWQAALHLCAAPLRAGGFITPAYVDAIIATHEKIGPYYVLAPQIALAHARPEDGALRQGLALLVLEQPVAFHSTENDPVDLVWMFCATDHKAHLSMLAALAELLDNAATLAAIRAATDAPAIAALAAPF